MVGDFSYYWVDFSVVDGQLVDDIKVLDHFGEFLKADLAVHVLVGLDDGAVDQLLQLYVIQVVADHHLEHGKELTVRDVAIIVDVINLESESQLFFLRRSSRQ